MATAVSGPSKELLFLGKECSHQACHLNDFLPFACPACHQPFCQPHFLPSHHACTAPLPPSLQNRTAPECPICHQGVPTTRPSAASLRTLRINISQGQGALTPDEAVDLHLARGDCLGEAGGEERRKQRDRQRRERGEVCWVPKCGKKLIVKMRCDACGHELCPTHRHPKDHACSKASTPITSRSSTPTTQPLPKPFARLNVASTSSPSSTTSTNTNPASARAAAAAAALKRAGQEVKQASEKVQIGKTKEEKRSLAEQESAFKALKARKAKGVLSKAEEVKYAEMVAHAESKRRLEGKGKSGKDDGCIVG